MNITNGRNSTYLDNAQVEALKRAEKKQQNDYQELSRESLAIEETLKESPVTRDESLFHVVHEIKKTKKKTKKN